jgi:hypothetical protein
MTRNKIDLLSKVATDVEWIRGQLTDHLEKTHLQITEDIQKLKNANQRSIGRKEMFFWIFGGGGIMGGIMGVIIKLLN